MVAGKVEVLHLTLQISACRVVVQNSPITQEKLSDGGDWYDVLCCSHGQLHCAARGVVSFDISVIGFGVIVVCRIESEHL